MVFINHLPRRNAGLCAMYDPNEIISKMKTEIQPGTYGNHGAVMPGPDRPDRASALRNFRGQQINLSTRD